MNIHNYKQGRSCAKNNDPIQRQPKRKKTMQEIKLSLSIENINLILEGLGNLPYAKVFNVVAIIQQQAAEQIETTKAPLNEENPETGQGVIDAEIMSTPKRTASAGK
jgi:hypothetical protein